VIGTERTRQMSAIADAKRENDSMQSNLVFSPGYSSDDGESRDQLDSFLAQCKLGFTESWTCKKSTELDDLHLFWFGKPANLIAAIGVSDGEVVEDEKGDWNQSGSPVGRFCGFAPLIALRHPIPLEDITSDPVLAKWWKGLPYRGGPKSIVDDQVAKHLATLIVSRNPKQTAIAKLLKPWLGAAQVQTNKQERQPETSPDSEASFLEGATREITAELASRNDQLRDAAIRSKGCACQCCGFDFEARYGTIGAGFIEVHHHHPLSAQKGKVRSTKLADVSVVCSNCHRMLHRNGAEPITVAKLKSIMKAQQS